MTRRVPAFAGRLWRLRDVPVLVAALSLAATCTPNAKPLQAPLDAAHVVAQGLHVAIAEADLIDLAEFVRQSPDNKLIVVPLPPFAVPGAGGGTVAATTLQAEVGAGGGGLTPALQVALSWPVTFAPLPLSFVYADGTNCGLLFAGDEPSSLQLALRFGRSPAGHAEVVLAQASELSLQGAAVADGSGCLATAPPGAASAIAQHIETAVRAAVASRYDATATAALRALLDVDMEQGGRVVAELGGREIELRLSARFSPPGGGAPAGGLLGGGESYGRARLEVGVDVDRHPCAPDVSPPGLAALPLSPIAPPAPGGASVLRRAVVIDRALIQHFAWAVARSGALCRAVTAGIEAGLPASWAGDVSPPLASWVEGGAVGARFWPGASPGVKVRDLGQGAALEWVLPGALLEVTTRVGGLEVAILSIEGQFRVTTWPTAVGAGGVRFEVREAAVDSAVVSSPLLSAEPKPSEAALATLVTQALIGIFSQPLGFEQTAGLSKVVGTARDGESLWLWLAATSPSRSP